MLTILKALFFGKLRTRHIFVQKLNMHYLYTLLLLLLTIPSNAQNALNFDGNDDIVQSNYAGPLGTTNRTFEAWVYVSSSAPLSNLCILDYGLNAVGSRNTFNVSGSRALSFISGGTNANISSSPNDVPVDQWAHVAFVLNSGTGYLYVDGVQVGTGNLTTVNTPSGNQNIKIGERVSGGSIPFHGSIDEVKIWDVARSQAEIQASMNDEVCNADPNLKLYYRFNEGVANGTNTGVLQASDDSGNGYIGVLSGFALTGNTSNWTTGVTLTPGMTSTLLQEDACETYTWSANGQTYTTSGIYSTVLTGATGCDSVLTLDLSVYSPNDLTTTQVSCGSFTWSVNGQTYTTSDTIVENLTTSQGCPYLHTLHLTINPVFDSVATIDACSPYVWPVNGQTYTIPGFYTETFTDMNGCDSTYSMNLNLMSTLSATITDNQDGTLSTPFSGILHWYDCTNDSIITGATDTVFTPTYNGSYAAIWTDWGFSCPDTSDCTTIDNVGLTQYEFDNQFTIHPNPTSGNFTLSLNPVLVEVMVEITDATGKVLRKRIVSGGVPVEMKLEGETGVYFVRARTQFGTFTKRIVKL